MKNNDPRNNHHDSDETREDDEPTTDFASSGNSSSDKTKNTEQISLEGYEVESPTEDDTDGSRVKQLFQESNRPAIALYLTNEAKPRTVTGQYTIHIGRGDPRSRIQPDVDLGTARGNPRAVSRRHAKIMFEDGACYIQDLSSSNGTWVDEQKLTPYVPHKITSGAFVRFGTLTGLLYVVHSSKRNLGESE